MESKRDRLRRRAYRLYTLAYATLHGLRVGEGVIIRPGARVIREYGGAISIGARTVVHPGAMLLSYGGEIRIGAHCSINPYCVLYGHGGLVIGDDVRIAAHCVFIPANHGTTLSDRPISGQRETRLGIRVGSNVWFGAGARVLDGADIEDGCVVAAGAVVRGKLLSNGIYGGVPARLLRMRLPRDLEKVANDRFVADVPETATSS